MSIASEITRINNNIASAYTACNNKGATMPVTQNSANLASTIATISGGGGGGANLQVKSETILTNGSHQITPDTGYDGMTAVNLTVSVPISAYVVADSTAFTLSSSSWVADRYTLTINTSNYNIDTTKAQIGLPTDSSAANTTNVLNAGITLISVETGTSANLRVYTFEAVEPPTQNVTILLFGVEAIS